MNAAVFQRKPLAAFSSPWLVTLFSSVRFSLPAFPGLCRARPPGTAPRRTPSRGGPCPGLRAAGSARTLRSFPAPRAARWGRGRQPEAAAARADLPPPAQPAGARSPRAGRAVTCRAPGGLLLPPRHAARAAAAVASAAAGVRGARGRGDAGPGRGRNSAARPTLASSPRAPGSGRAADGGRRSHGPPRPGRSAGGGGGRAGRSRAAGLRAERAGPGRRARSHPRRGPRAQRRALGRPTRGPRSMPLALCWAGAVRAPPGAPAPSWASRESPRATFSAPLCWRWGSRRALLVRGSQLSHCAPARPTGCPFLPALSLGGRKQTRQE